MGNLRGRHRYTFQLRRDVQWHSNANFKPSRPMNADDIIFAIDRQWKPEHPYFKVTSSNHSYLTTWASEIAQVGGEGRRLHNSRHAQSSRGAVPVQSGDGIRRHPVEGICRRDAQGRHAEKIDQEPIAAAVHAGAVPKGRNHSLSRLPDLLRRQGEDRRPDLRDHAGRFGALGKTAARRMPRHALPKPGRSRCDAQGCEHPDPRTARPEHRLPRVQHDQKAVR